MQFSLFPEYEYPAQEGYDDGEYNNYDPDNIKYEQEESHFQTEEY